MTTMAKEKQHPWLRGAVLVAALASGWGCGGDGATDVDSDAETGSEGGPFFAVPTQVFGADFATATSYVPVVSSLDEERISLDAAREIDGRVSVAAIGEWLFIAGSTEPIIDRYAIADDGTLSAAGSLSFANYGVPEYFSIDDWGNVSISPTKAYIFNANNGSHIIWNPTTLEITGEIPGPDVVQEGYSLESISIVRGNRMYRVFTLLSYDSWEFLPEPQYLAVYDLDSDELIDVAEEARCPQLYSRPFIDENDDIYFSGWVWTPGLTLVGGYPKNCALRVLAGQDSFDPDWQLSYADDVTDGREAGILRYLGNGRALLDVFHDERVTIDATTDAEELANTANWRLWSVELETRAGAPVEGLDFKAGGYTDVPVDGRTFLMVPNDDYSETTAYEVVDGEAVPGFKIQGSSYQMARVR